MKWIFAFVIFCLAPIAFAQAPADPSVGTTVIQAPVVVVPASSDVAAVAANPIAAPPAWATELLSVISGLPIVGPILSKAMTYLGILGALMTALVAFLLAAASALKNVTAWAGLASLAAKVQAFQQSQIMYWLTTLSMFNAKVPPPAPTVADAVIKAQS